MHSATHSCMRYRQFHTGGVKAFDSRVEMGNVSSHWQIPDDSNAPLVSFSQLDVLCIASSQALVPRYVIEKPTTDRERKAIQNILCEMGLQLHSLELEA